MKKGRRTLRPPPWFFFVFFFVFFDPFVPFVVQKSNCALTLKSRARVTDTGSRYVGPYDCR